MTEHFPGAYSVYKRNPTGKNYFKVPKTAKSDVHLTIFSIDNIIQNAMPLVVDYITRP